MQRVLVSLRLILVLESIAAVSTFILFFCFMRTIGYKRCLVSVVLFRNHMAIARNLPQFIASVELLGLLGTAVAHVKPLNLPNTSRRP